jgi:hypothetical protein
MQNTTNGCDINEINLQHGIRAITMENDQLFISILPDKGADIYQFIYKPKDIDVLWKAPWGLKKPDRGIETASNSQIAWMEHYAGGWQELFPNGGAACLYKGVQLNFHGEISTLAWDYKILSSTPDEVAVSFFTNTYRSPFRVERTMVLRANQRHLEITERITNLAEEEMDYMWGHHPAFGAPFIDEGTLIHLPEHSWIESQAEEMAPARMLPGTRGKWPYLKGQGGGSLDLSVIPSRNERSADLAFIGGFAEGWYGITNPKLGLGFGMVWPADIFPYMWFWQELKGSFGYPWYGANYVAAIEPFSSYDASGLTNCIEKGTSKSLKPGESVQATLLAVCYESTKGINRIDTNGYVHIIN